MSTIQSNAPASNAPADDLRLVEALRKGDEAAFAWMVDRYHASLRRLAQLYVADRATAEDVVQETWLGVLNGLGRFEGRSSLKTWIFHILTNTARRAVGANPAAFRSRRCGTSTRTPMNQRSSLNASGPPIIPGGRSIGPTTRIAGTESPKIAFCQRRPSRTSGWPSRRCRPASAK